VPEEKLTITIKLKDFATRGLKKFHGAVTRVAAKVRAKLMAVKSAVFSLKGALVALGGAAVARSFIEAGAQLEKFRTQLVAVMDQNEALADSTLSWVREFAKLTPHATADVIQAFVSLQAAGVQANKQMMDTLGNVAYVFDRNIADVSLGLVSMEKEIFKRLGIQWEIVGDKAKIWSGNVVAHTDKAADSMRKGILEIWEKKFPGAMKRAEDDYKGLMELLKSQWWEFRAQVMKSGVMDFLKEGMAKVAEQFGGMEKAAPKFADALVKGMKTAILYGARLADSFTVTRKAWNLFQQAVLVSRAKFEKFRSEMRGRMAGERFGREDKKHFTDTELALRNIREDAEKIGGSDSAFAKATEWLSKMENGAFEAAKAIDRMSASQKKFNDALFGRMMKPFRDIREDAERTKKALAGVYTADQVAAMNKAEKHAREIARLEEERVAMHGSMVPLMHDAFEAQMMQLMVVASQAKMIEAAKKAETAVRLKETEERFRGIKAAVLEIGGVLEDNVLRALDSAVEGTFRWQKALQQTAKDFGMLFAKKATGALLELGATAVAGSLAAKGGVFNAFSSRTPIKSYAKGGITQGPEIAIIGEGKKQEAVVPLDNGQKIPVEMKGGGESPAVVIYAMDGADVMRVLTNNPEAVAAGVNRARRNNPGFLGAGA
jgi:uncharacterized protein YigA (DUF484 family)